MSALHLVVIFGIFSLLCALIGYCALRAGAIEDAAHEAARSAGWPM